MAGGVCLTEGKAERTCALTEAERQLVERNIKLVPYALKYCAWKHLGSYEDAFQVGCIGLMRAARQYNPEKGSFGSFAFLCIRHEIAREHRATQTRRELANTLALSLDAPINDLEGSKTLLDLCGRDQDMEADALARIDTARAMEQAMRYVQEQEREMLRLMRQGLNMAEVGRKLGCTRACVSKHMQAIRERFFSQDEEADER